MIQDSRYLCLNLGADEYAIPLLAVKEIIGLPEMTAVPQTASHFSGLMNLRGKIISVMDLRLKLGVKALAGNETTVIILEFDGQNLGVIVDRVNSVQVLTSEMRSEKPRLENSKSNAYVSGVFRKEEKLVLILDVTKALLSDKAA